jgi:hypothetical protein
MPAMPRKFTVGPCAEYFSSDGRRLHEQQQDWLTAVTAHMPMISPQAGGAQQHKKPEAVARHVISCCNEKRLAGMRANLRSLFQSWHRGLANDNKSEVPQAVP